MRIKGTVALTRGPRQALDRRVEECEFVRRSVSALSVVLCINFSCEDLHHVQQAMQLVAAAQVWGTLYRAMRRKNSHENAAESSRGGRAALACPPQCGWGSARWGPAGFRPVPVPVPGTGTGSGGW